MLKSRFLCLHVRRDWVSGCGQLGFVGSLLCHVLNGLFVGGAEDAAFGDDGGDVLCGGDVDGGVFDAYAVWGHLLAVGVGDFGRGALFDGDEVAVRGGEVEGRPGGGDVVGNGVLLCEDGHAVGADLVGDVAVGGDAVGADDDGLDAALAHERGGQVVA